MSNDGGPDTDTYPVRPNTAIVVCLTLIIIAVLAAITSISLGPGEDGRAATVITILGGALATLVTGFLVLAGVRNVAGKVNAVNSKVDKVLNGVMDAKIKKQVRLALSEHEEEKAGATK